MPKIDVLVSGSFRSTPGVAPAGGLRRQQRQLAVGELQRLERDPAGADRAAADAWPGVHRPSISCCRGTRFPIRLNSLDLRFGKNLRFGRTRTNVAIDLYNLFNSNTGTAYNQTYDPVTNGATWLAPTQVLNPRFARFNVTFDF